MRRAERKEETVGTNDNYVSSYLLRPRKSYAEAVRDAVVKTAQAYGGQGGATTNRAEDEGGVSGIPRRDRRRESETRR